MVISSKLPGRNLKRKRFFVSTFSKTTRIPHFGLANVIARASDDDLERAPSGEKSSLQLSKNSCGQQRLSTRPMQGVGLVVTKEIGLLRAAALT